MRYGFTGTQLGMSERQKCLLRAILKPGDVLHHGDCIGADAEAAAIAKEIGCRTVAHPPLDPSKRAFTENDYEYMPKDYLPRNQSIVEKTAKLLAAPREGRPFLRSGTWSTVRYAHRCEKPYQILER